VAEGTPINVDHSVAHTIGVDEDTTGFDVAFSGEGGDCDDASVTPDEGEALECTITLTAQQATLQVNVVVVGSTDSFTPTIDAGTVAEGTPINVDHSVAHTIGVDEDTTGFDVAFSGEGGVGMKNVQIVWVEL
jgi:hypothetical protein